MICKSKILIYKVLFITLILTFFTTATINAQLYNRNEAVCVYIYNFCKQIDWNFEVDPENFSILLISDNEELISEFTRFASQKKINDLEIKLKVQISEKIDLENTQLIFIDEENSYNYFSVFEQIQGHSILIVSENYTDKKFVMINLYDADNNHLLFEINKANIINQGITVKPDILLYGGSEIDVAKLYKDSQNSLLGMDKELKEFKVRIDSINSAFLELQTDIIEKQKELEKQNNLLSEKEIKLEELNKSVFAKELLYKYQEMQLKIKNDSLFFKTKQLSVQEQLFDSEMKKLDTLQFTLNQKYTDISEMDKEIKTKNEVLGLQNITISRQRNFLYLFTIIALLTIIIIIVLYKGFKNKQRLNAQITFRKEEIERIIEKLQNSNEELQSKNEQLNLANRKITSTIEMLQQTQMQLVQAEKMASLGVLTAGIAHEINNPINFVYAGINSLKKDFDDLIPVLDEVMGLDKSKQVDINQFIKKLISLKENDYFADSYDAIPTTIKDIQVGAERVAEIVKGLRNFSRLEQQNWAKENIHKGLESALLLLKNSYKHHVEIIKNYDENLPEIVCLPGKINQVFMNILKNAIDAISEKGKVEIRTSFDNKKIYVSIKDNGIGIDNEIKSKIFDPFFTTKEIGKGTGLGLSITYGVIKEHNGDVDIISEIGKGTEFLISLPINRD